MPGCKFERMTRIKAVEREYAAMRFAVERLSALARHDPNVLKNDLKPQDLQMAADRLEGTYAVRLFAEYEAGLRSYWRASKDSVPLARDLIESIGRRCKIPEDQIAKAHRVREWRNSVVHEHDHEVEKLPIALARGHLCHFFSFLPHQW